MEFDPQGGIYAKNDKHKFGGILAEKIGWGLLYFAFVPVHGFHYWNGLFIDCGS
jgi:hypothetical protein